MAKKKKKDASRKEKEELVDFANTIVLEFAKTMNEQMLNEAIDNYRKGKKEAIALVKDTEKKIRELDELPDDYNLFSTRAGGKVTLDLLNHLIEGAEELTEFTKEIQDEGERLIKDDFTKEQMEEFKAKKKLSQTKMRHAITNLSAAANDVESAGDLKAWLNMELDLMKKVIADALAMQEGVLKVGLATRDKKLESLKKDLEDHKKKFLDEIL